MPLMFSWTAPRDKRAPATASTEGRRRVFISAGELSGDIAGAALTVEIRRRDPTVHVFGTGGPHMAEAGADIAGSTNRIGVVGITEALATIPSVLQVCRDIARSIRETRPDVAVLIGNDVFNVVLARWLRRRGVPTVSYFPPQAWIWRSLARPIARSFDAVLATFPEEYEVYARARERTEVTFTGHYLADRLAPATDADRQAARRALGLPAGDRVVALLPGSRPHELRSLSAVMWDSAAQLLARDPMLRFVVPVADAGRVAAVTRELASRPIASRTCVCRDSHTAMRSANLAILASGTASLEAALLGIPMIIVYRVSAITHVIVRAAIRLGLIKSYTVGLPNLVLGRGVVPEVLQQRVTWPVLADQAWTLLSDPAALESMHDELVDVAARLRRGQAVETTADAVLAWADAGRRRQRAAGAIAGAVAVPAGTLDTPDAK